MASKNTGGTAARKRAKDQEMAARLKADGIKREVSRCPICNAIVGYMHLYNHISLHK